ncbi:MAG TPA: Mur ligase family protein [Labilithrix sp.]|nr:Mur ligase family protein [Labilithrix sp.]
MTRARPYLAGVTGTNGKTSTTRWLAAALAAPNRSDVPVACLDSLAWRLGDRDLGSRRDEAALASALDALERERGAAAVIELTSHALGTGFARSLDFRLAVFTNLTQEHLELHHTYERYLACKAQLFVRLGAGATAVLNARDDASRLIRGVLPNGTMIRTYGTRSRGPAWCTPDVEAVDVVVDRDGTSARLVWANPDPDAPQAIRLRALGEVFVENALAALLGARAAGVPLSVASAAIADCEAPPGRFTRVASSPDVYVDVAHSPDALARTLGAARSLANVSGGRVLLVFGSGGQRDVEKRRAMGRAAGGADVAIITSDEARGGHPLDVAQAIASGMSRPERARIELDRVRAVERALSAAHPNDVVVIAGRGPLGAPAMGTTQLASDALIVKTLLGRSPDAVR